MCAFVFWLNNRKLARLSWKWNGFEIFASFFTLNGCVCVWPPAKYTHKSKCTEKKKEKNKRNHLIHKKGMALKIENKFCWYDIRALNHLDRAIYIFQACKMVKVSVDFQWIVFDNFFVSSIFHLCFCFSFCWEFNVLLHSTHIRSFSTFESNWNGRMEKKKKNFLINEPVRSFWRWRSIKKTYS